jgi:prepilin-type N-terminal cleavage/methylation domain-containing protein
MLPQNRQGFTLVEVLIASSILVLGLTGIMMMALSSLRKSGVPENVQGAILCAQERLDYFRSQANPFRAAGGTYYLPPPNPRVGIDYNLQPAGNAFNNIFNGGPVLLVREYIRSTNEKRYAGDVGRANQLNRTTSNLTAAQLAQIQQGLMPLATYGVNEIPATPAACLDGAAIIALSGVTPNDDVGQAWPVPANWYTGVCSGPVGSRKGFIRAPRCNDNIRPGIAPAAWADVRYVREVWVQSNNPNYPAGDFRTPPGTSVAIWTAATQDAAGGLSAYVPRASVFGQLPPFVMMVTVRVYARDPRTVTLAYGNPGAANVRMPPVANDSGTTGPGYDRRRPPLSSLVAYYGLTRN